MKVEKAKNTSSGGLKRQGKSAYAVLYAFRILGLDSQFLDVWSIKDLNGYAEYADSMISKKGNTKEGKTYSNKNLSNLLGG